METLKERHFTSILILISSTISLLCSILMLINEAGMFWFVLLFALSVTGIIRGIIGLSFIDRGNYEDDIRKEKKKQLFAEQDKDCCTKNGDLTIAFRWRDYDSFSAIRVFENKNLITINNKEYMFDDIISCELSNNNSVLMANTVTKTSTGSMLGRAVVGGLLFGGVG